MAKSKRRHLSADEQEIVDQLQVRLLTTSKDTTRCDQLIVEHHYLQDATLVGEQLRYVATYKGQWLALATWSGAAFHLKDRDQFIGWDFEQCRRRRALLANNSRLLVLPKCHSPNLISRFMKLMLGRLSQDWLWRWGHPIALVESFVDPQLYQGTAYKVSGWSHLGRTAGSAMPRIFISSTMPPRRSGFASWLRKPASNCGRRNCHRNGPWWKAQWQRTVPTA